MQAPNNKSTIPRWVKIGYIPLAALTALIAYRIDLWVGHVTVILLTFVMTWFVEPKARRAARFVHVIFVSTLLFATLFIQFLSTPDRIAAIESNGLLNFLLGGIGARIFVSIVTALLFSLVLLLGPILIVLFASTEWILAMPEVHGVTRRQAMRLLLSLVFNTAYPYFLVENGEVTLCKPSGILPELGGPGVAVVKPYNAVVFERGGNITRVEGPGMFLTKRFEFVKEVINLRKQWIDFTAEDVLTKDHVPLTFHCGVGFRIEARKDTAKRVEDHGEAYEGSRFTGIIGGDYPVYKRTIYRAAYGTTAAGWKLLSKGATETKLREVLREYRLEDLYRLEDNQLASADSAIDQIAEEVIRRVSAVSPTWGTTVYSLTIKSFEAPEDVKEKLLDMWSKRYAVRTLLMEAAGDKEAALTKLEADETITIRIAEAERHAALTKLEADELILIRLAEAERDAALTKLEADEQVRIRIAGAERDAALAMLLAERQRIISLSDAERLAIAAKARGEGQALLESASAQREAERIQAEGARETVGIKAEAFLEEARAKSLAEVEHIRAKAGADKDAALMKLEADKVIKIRIAEAERDAALAMLEADEVIKIRIAGAERDAALAMLLAERQRIISLSDAERLAMTAKASGEGQALLESASARREAERIEAEGAREIARIKAETFLEEARAKAEAAIIEGRGAAEARAELLRRMLALEPSMDRKTLWTILTKLQSAEAVAAMERLLLESGEYRRFGRIDRIPPPSILDLEAETDE